jgi:hypothetical protein
VLSNAFAADGGEWVRIWPSNLPGQLIRLLDGLARMTIYPIQGFTELLRMETQSLPVGSTVVVITPVLPVALRAVLVRLRERGLRGVVCALSDEAPPPVPGLRLYHLPPPREAEFLRRASEIERARIPDDMRRTAPGAPPFPQPAEGTA